jgi:hypothetical protein
MVADLKRKLETMTQEQLDALDAAREAKGAAEDKKNNAKP